MRATILMLGLVVNCHAEADRSVVRFTNGDILSGELLSLSSDALEWKSEILKDPAQFDLKHLLDLQIPAKVVDAKEGKGQHIATLEMRSSVDKVGDIIKGKLVGITEKEIVIDTKYAGRLNVNKLMVKQISVDGVSEILYQGPEGIEDWYMEDGDTGWQFKAGALQSGGPGAISREIEFTEECKIAFDAAWKGGFRPRMIIFSDDYKAGMPSGGYELVFQTTSIHLKRAGTNEWFGHSQNVMAMREQEKVRIEIRASLKTGKILLYVNGELMEIFDDPEVKSMKLGKGFHIIAQDNTPVRFSNILVSKWDGYIDEAPKRRNNMQFQRFGGGRMRLDFQDEMDEPQVETEEEQEEGRMKLINGDSIKGEVIGIEGETIKVKTELADMSFPVHRLKNLLLSGLNQEDPKIYKGDIRATMSDGSKIVFRLDEVKDGKLIGFSQNFGKAEFPEDVFNRIEFNIYKPGLEDIRQKSDW